MEFLLRSDPIRSNPIWSDLIRLDPIRVESRSEWNGVKCTRTGRNKKKRKENSIPRINCIFVHLFWSAEPRPIQRAKPLEKPSDALRMLYTYVIKRIHCSMCIQYICDTCCACWKFMRKAFSVYCQLAERRKFTVQTWSWSPTYLGIASIRRRGQKY